MEPYLGMIMPIGFNFAPRGWALCEGQLLPISQNTALFSLLGTAFGGDGRTTFALPDLRGRSMVGVGSGAGLPHVSWGQRGGSTSFTLSVSEMPSHTHTLYGVNDVANKRTPGGNLLAADDSGDGMYIAGKTPNAPLQSNANGNTGGGQSVAKRSPYLGIYICIALTGIFPSRS